jgi:hypothetical protein
VRRRRRVARSATSCFVFKPTLCQTGSSCRRTMASNERKYAFSTFKSSRSSYNQKAGVSNLKMNRQLLTHCCIRSLKFRQCRRHTLHDGPMNVLHRLRERLIQLNDVCSPSLKRPLDFLVKPRIYVYLSKLELLHYVLERRHPRGDVFRLVGESFEEAGCVFFTIQSDYKRFKGEGRYSGCNVGHIIEELGMRTYFSACRTRIPVIRSIGMSDCSMSTTRIREVTDISPPLLYKSCLHIPINGFTSAQENSSSELTYPSFPSRTPPLSTRVSLPPSSPTPLQWPTPPLATRSPTRRGSEANRIFS